MHTHVPGVFKAFHPDLKSRVESSRAFVYARASMTDAVQTGSSHWRGKGATPQISRPLTTILRCIDQLSQNKMPPIVPRKRLRKSPLPHDAPGHGKVPPTQSTNKRKATLYDDLDASATPLSSKDSGFILENYQDNGSISSLTSLSDEDFEDVPPAKRQKTSELKDEDEDTNIEFEDVTAPVASAADAPITSGDLELTLNRDSHLSLIDSYGSKKGPTKREKQVRRATHCLHVLFLLWHNAVRNSWLSHPEMQAIMLSHLPPRMWEEVDRWRQNSGLERRPPQQRNGKGKQDACRKTKNGSREWDKAAEKLEAGSVDMSHGDPIFRMMQSLASWWKQRFRVVNPGLRKWGYMDLERLDRLTKAHRTQAYDPVRFGEKVSDLKDMMRSARRCQGSRDVGAQLFTTLLRGLGLEARMVVNLQCLGFGWNKLEDADPENEADMAKCRRNGETSSKGKETASGNTQHSRTNMRGSRGPPAGPKKEQTNYITLDDTDDLGLEFNDTDDESVVELSSTPKRPPKPMKKFDSDLEFPHYWTEVLSPVTRTYLPVDPIVKGVIATNRELIETLEPRGAKAERSREIVAYIIGYSPDGTAKDVTVRYLKNQRLPGRTKGNRMPIEKLPVYNRIGKVKRYEQYDWFKTAMSGYRRGDVLHPVTEVDETEDATDLKPSQPEKKQVKEGEETLQYYKQSKEYILERHLKREEALRPGAKPVRVFKNKAKGAKGEEEDVYLRSDAVHVRSAETWHKQGRAPKPGTQPLKHVPYRAATLNRRREILEAEAATGEKVLQGLFSIDQTEWIVPPPIKDGVIPKNEYG